MRRIFAQPLTAEAFRPFGDVIEEESRKAITINRGAAVRFHDLAQIETDEGGRVALNIFRALVPVTLPYCVPLLECHPLGSQAFIPCEKSRFLIVVAPPGDSPDIGAIAAFVTNGAQGASYRRGVWHAPLASFSASTYTVIDRIGQGENLREYDLVSQDELIEVCLPSRSLDQTWAEP